MGGGLPEIMSAAVDPLHRDFMEQTVLDVCHTAAPHRVWKPATLLAMIIVIAFAMIRLSVPDTRVATSADIPRPALKAITSEKQFADEIIRRLRRLGLYFNPGRLSRPYDPDGELA